MDATTEGKILAWTEEAKYQFLLRIIAQLKEDGRSVKWEKINMPGRTTKSLQNMWTKIKKAVDEIENENAGSTPAKPTSSTKKTPTRGRPKKKVVVQQRKEEDEEDVDDKEHYSPIPLKLPKKRGRENDQVSDLKRMKKEQVEGEYSNDFAKAIKDEDNAIELLFPDC